jgi:hypothetical protein
MFKNSLQKKLRSRFYVTPKFGIDFQGILIQCDKGEGGYSVFADVVAYPEESEPQPIKGELYIRNSEVAFTQLVP